MDPVILSAREITIKTTNEPPTLQEKMKNQSTVTSVKYSNEEKATIEKLTRKQKDTVHWFKYRHGLITASNFHSVKSHLNSLKKKGPTQATQGLVDTLIHGSTFKGNISTKYGQVNEPKALAKYMDIMKEGHSGCKLKTSGLVI